MLVVSVRAGQEVLSTVAEQARERGITDAAIVSLVGAVGSACISNMREADAGSDTLTEYVAPMELSGTGELRDGASHIHCVLSTEGDRALAGHLHWAKVDQWFVRVYLMPL